MAFAMMPSDMATELYYSWVFKYDLSKLLALTDAGADDYVFLPTAHGRELHAISELCHDDAVMPEFGLEFRHALEFPVVPVRNGGEHTYVRQHRFYFAEVRRSGLSPGVRLFTDTNELAIDYERFSALPFRVLPIPFRHSYLEAHEVLPPGADERLRLVYLGDPRSEKGFHWLSHLVDFLAKDYLSTGKVCLEIQASAHPSYSDSACLSALSILKSYPREWLTLHGLDGPLSAEDYHTLVASAAHLYLPLR